MKILQVIDRLDVGGAERVAVDVSILLSKSEKNSLSFLCLLDASVLDEELEKEGIPIIYLERTNKYNPLILLKLLKILNNYDVVHVHSRHVLRYVGLTFLPFFKRTYKVVFHDHYGNIDTNKAISGYLKFCIQNTAAYIGVSKSLTTWAKQHHLNTNIQLLSNIVRKKKTEATITTQSSIVVIGNFRPQKNYEFLCKLIKKLPNHISIDLYGNIVDNDYYNKIVDLKDQLHISEQLQIINGQKNVTQLLKNYKLALHCASSETGPLVAIEYMSQGLPVIMYQTGEVSDTIAKYTKDLLMQNFDFSAWKIKILELLDNEVERDNYANLILRIFNENYSEKKYIETCQQIYQDILNY